MKTLENRKTKLFMIVLLAALLSNTLFAKSSLPGLVNELESRIKESCVINLVKGIESDNIGLKRSCIYFAGLYEIKGTVDALVKQLQMVEDPDTRILITLALYKIGDKDGIKAIEQLAKNDESAMVREMSAALLNQFRIDVAGRTVKISGK
jgi:HEAT repeat protein